MKTPIAILNLVSLLPISLLAATEISSEQSGFDFADAINPTEQSPFTGISSPLGAGSSTISGSLSIGDDYDAFIVKIPKGFILQSLQLNIQGIVGSYPADSAVGHLGGPIDWSNIRFNQSFYENGNVVVGVPSGSAVPKGVFGFSRVEDTRLPIVVSRDSSVPQGEDYVENPESFSWTLTITAYPLTALPEPQISISNLEEDGFIISHFGLLEFSTDFTNWSYLPSATRFSYSIEDATQIITPSCLHPDAEIQKGPFFFRARIPSIPSLE
ncbi:hypothetical protein V2O64_24570 (plasmid) [Verrucomicrobiaceae bacterium 227]